MAPWPNRILPQRFEAMSVLDYDAEAAITRIVGPSTMRGKTVGDILDCVVIGAGSAGLGVSYFLKTQGLTHCVLERNRIGETWRTQRWNSFRLNSTNIRTMLPGDSYDGPDPWGAITHHEFVHYLEKAMLTGTA